MRSTREGACQAALRDGLTIQVEGALGESQSAIHYGNFDIVRNHLDFVISMIETVRPESGEKTRLPASTPFVLTIAAACQGSSFSA